MPWCPKCKAEYRDGFNLCSDCNTELVTQLEADDYEVSENGEEALLTSVSDRMEAELMESLLRAYNIPVYKKEKGADQILLIEMGRTNQEIDIYVPSSLLVEAKEIIESQPQLEDSEFSQEELIKEDNDKFEDDYRNKRRIRTWIILGVFFIPGLIAIIITFIFMMIQIFKQGF